MCESCTEGFCTNRCDIKVKNLDPEIQVSDCGLVWRVKRGQLNRIKPYWNKGILYVDLFRNGGQKRLAEVVLTTFGVEGSGWIEYRDGNKENCTLKNIEWRK